MKRVSISAGFSLADLIVLLGVVTLLLAMLAPAINQGREKHRILSSRNNIRQLALAMLNHNDSYKTYPPPYYISSQSKIKNKLNPLDAKGMYSWQVRLLPFWEEDFLYKKISTASDKFTLHSDSIRITHLDKKDVSPGTISFDNLHIQSPEFKFVEGPYCNYAVIPANRLPSLLLTVDQADGSQTWKTVELAPDGQIIPDKLGRGQPEERMTDGASKTLVLCESRETEHSNWYDPQQGFVCGFLPEDTQPVEDQQTQYYPYFKQSASTALPEWNFNPQKANRTALEYGPTEKDVKRAYYAAPNDPLTRSWGPSAGYSTGFTLHCSGDSSVHALTVGMDPRVYFALITAAGQEKFDLPNTLLPAEDKIMTIQFRESTTPDPKVRKQP